MFQFKVDLLSELNKRMEYRSKNRRIYTTPRELPHIYPTDASVQWNSSNGLVITEGKCLRSIWYRLNEYPETDEPKDIERLRWVWRMGYMFEEECQKLSEEQGILAGKSIKITDSSLPLLISGEMDAVNYYVDSSGEKNFYVVDYKTAGGNYYGNTKLLGNKSTTPTPKTENLLQLMVYLKCDPRLKFGMLFYLIRDRMERVQFHIELHKDKKYGVTVPFVNGTPYPEYNLEEIYRRYALLVEYYMNEELPPRDYQIEYDDNHAIKLNEIGELSDSKLKKHLTGRKHNRAGDWQCAYCPYKTLCHSK